MPLEPRGVMFAGHPFYKYVFIIFFNISVPMYCNLFKTTHLVSNGRIFVSCPRTRWPALRSCSHTLSQSLQARGARIWPFGVRHYGVG